MISTTVLNSMNREKRTLLHFLIGAVLMILSILFLTKYVGVYSYMIGLAASYVITCVLNLILLKKMCGVLKYIKYTAHALIVIFSACAFGLLLDGIISKYVPVMWQIIILGVTESPIKNAPKSFFKTNAGSKEAKKPAATEVISAGITMLFSPSVFKSPFLR